MKKKLLLALAFTSTIAAVAQPLKFEIKERAKPSHWSQLYLVENFSNANRGTTDFYSKSDNKIAGIPNNYMGTQEPSIGDKYLGIITYYGDEALNLNKNIFSSNAKGYDKYSEYVQTSLPTGLKPGQEYTASFKVSLAEKSAYANSGLGVYFSDAEVKSESNARLNFEPIISSSTVIKESTEWVEIKGNFIASGNEKFMVIGVFNKNFAIEKIVQKNQNNLKRAYYYVSDISIAEYIKPDSDKDGISDDKDECPTVFGLTSLNGCPDTDGDGITDAKDNCPNIAGITAMKGCPDTDGDGITDNDDRCPKIKGTTKSNGCPDEAPVVNSEAKKVFDQALTGIQFESGKDIIKKTSYPILDNVASVLQKNPDYIVDIHGHTDSQGNDELNRVLSEKRAIAVKNYLVNKGINSSRMSPAGFGETIAIADNATPAGRAKNRRVEFKVKY